MTVGRSVALARQATWLVLAVPLAAALAYQGRSRAILVGDPSPMMLRAAQVGTHQTPLVGSYSTHGWAHPGPAIFWLSAPLARLLPGSPLAMSITALVIAGISIAGIAWATSGGPLTTALAPTAAVVVAFTVLALRGDRLVTVWNPLLPLLPLLFVCFAAWRTAGGDHRWAIPTLAVGALVAQAHIAMIPLIALVVAWLLAWVLQVRPWLEGRRSTVDGPAGVTAPRLRDLGPGTFGRSFAIGSAVAGAMWLPTLLDEAFGTGNLLRSVHRLGISKAPKVGFGDALGIVARYGRPGGSWMGAATPLRNFSVATAPAWTAIAFLVALAVVTVALARRGEVAATAGASLALLLSLAAIPLAARVEYPVYEYLVAWLIPIAAFSWCALAVGVWRLVHHLAPRPVPVAATVAGIAVVIGASAWCTRTSVVDVPAFGLESRAVTTMAERLDAKLPHHRPVHLEVRGDHDGHILATLVPMLLRKGLDVRTSDGEVGQKYGPDAEWNDGDPKADGVYTVTVTFSGSLRGLAEACRKAPDTTLVSRFDELGATRRRWLTGYLLDRTFHGLHPTPAQGARAGRLARHDLAIEVFHGPVPCAPLP